MNVNGIKDPRLPELEQVSVEFERTFAKWHCDITKRVFKIRYL